MTILDRYFERPLFYDYFLGTMALFGILLIQNKWSFTLPKMEKILSLSSDLATISLTLAGFILTFLTVIVTFKTAAKKPDKKDNSDVTLFDLFFNTKFYFQTTSLLKGGIKSLVVLSVMGLVLKMFLEDKNVSYMFYFNIIWLTVIALTMWRNILILTKIIDLHKEFS